ncbi:hypothetical protein E2C01_101600 [Portunus trituberculatus]|uniref:Uncharacterized protein n=1 Tax=Portunus trituberculatus TaxID=210409 RepID=A0A5B7KA07_PORTR|nr:hypothetical protein [Portunus trituberculatus]
MGGEWRERGGLRVVGGSECLAGSVGREGVGGREAGSVWRETGRLGARLRTARQVVPPCGGLGN